VRPAGRPGLRRGFDFAMTGIVAVSGDMMQALRGKNGAFHGSLYTLLAEKSKGRFFWKSEILGLHYSTETVE
jgi:hypothetical protein